MGTMPVRLTSPTVGLMPTRRFCEAGLRIDPDVSVPTPPMAKFPETGGPRPRAGAAGGQRRAAVVQAVARVGPRIERIEPVPGAGQIAAALEEPEAEQGAIARGHGQGDEVGELGQRALSQDDRARRAQLLRDESVL